MITVNRIIVVEGTHDIDAVKRVCDATVISTGGFGIFTDRALADTLRKMAQKRGVIVLTDRDAAGFAIRNRLVNVIGKEYVTNVYIPDIYGKERRKTHPSKEGKLGVEGMTDEILLQAFAQAGITAETAQKERYLSKVVFYEDGFSGRPNSRVLCDRIKKKLNLPERLSTNKLIDVLDVLLTREEYEKLRDEVRQSDV